MFSDSEKIDRFLLVLLVARRVREIENGALLTRPRGKHRDIVLALNEIKERGVDLEELYKGLKAELSSDVSSFSGDEISLEDEDIVMGQDQTFIGALEAATEVSEASEEVD